MDLDCNYIFVKIPNRPYEQLVQRHENGLEIPTYKHFQFDNKDMKQIIAYYKRYNHPMRTTQNPPSIAHMRNDPINAAPLFKEQDLEKRTVGK